MKKLTFNAELRDRLKNFQEKLGPTISDDAMSQVVGGVGCGGICRITCSWHCREEIINEQIIMRE